MMKVHILLAGMPLCRFTTEVPARWPDGHFWRHGDEPNDTMDGYRDCKECVREWMQLKKNKPND